VRDRLADDLARVLRAEPLGLPCHVLARRVHRRRAVVRVTLRDDPRFEHYGRTHGSRWRLSVEMGRGRNGTGDRGSCLPWSGLDHSGVPLVGRAAETGS
jgi:hypothetical protein